MKNLMLLLILSACSHGRLPISKDYEDHSLLMCSYVLKPQNSNTSAVSGYEFNLKKFEWKDWNWKKEAQYIKLDHDSVKKILILGSKFEDGYPTRVISSVYFVNYSQKPNQSFLKDFEFQNQKSTIADRIEKLQVDGWTALGQDYTYMTNVGLQRIYDSTNCGVSCIRYFLVREKSEEELADQCRKQIKIFELEGQGPAGFVHHEPLEN